MEMEMQLKQLNFSWDDKLFKILWSNKNNFWITELQEENIRNDKASVKLINEQIDQTIDWI